ncbi:unnamed protein product [Rhizoctonia solani]|uniref:C2H2-type domain-containing protein n=1 Tax=Rhizoctonia solani TaxID=456999 RepID=A0A8H3E349_9AGAM|nr:unnamed protein product [Rhizoctonia solani]CAE7182413.1 unnamed protein product [Rhizoctonia solani]
MFVDQPRQQLPGIQALFGIGRNDHLSAIATIPHDQPPRHLESRLLPGAPSEIPDLPVLSSSRPSTHAVYPPQDVTYRAERRDRHADMTPRALPTATLPSEASHHRSHHRRVSSGSGSSISASTRSRSPIAPAQPHSQHVLMRVQPPQAEDFSKEFLSAKYECQYCGKRFNRPSSLKIHVNTHTGEKPYQCTFPSCGRRFSVMSNMRRHSRVHSQSSPGTGVNLSEWRSDDEEGSVSSNGASACGSPSLVGARRTSPLAQTSPSIHPYARSPSLGMSISPPTREIADMGFGSSAALYRLPLVPHYGP